MADLSAKDKPRPWMPECDPFSLKVLGKAAEEVSELGSALARCIIQGIGEAEPVTGKPNREWLEDEIADVEANIELLKRRFGLDRRRVQTRKWNKIRFLTRWLEMMAYDVVTEIATERRRQIHAEGWTPEHDDEHADGEMAAAAACYAAYPLSGFARKKVWPWAKSWWKPKCRRRDLIRAGALIIAEVERLDRAEARS